MNSSYDELHFSSRPSPERHPDRLATMARLFGLDAPHPETATILELGCSTGASLIPLAVALPRATFVGIDNSAAQIGEAVSVSTTLKLANVAFENQDILEFDSGGRRFDYILCNGVFSWVGANVQQKIFEICGRALSPNGVALVSFNSSPGWNMRGVLRQAIAFRDRRDAPRDERLVEARLLLKFMSTALTDDMRPFSNLLKQEVEGVKGQSDSYLFHELIEPVDEPIQFSEFIARAERAGLQYLADAKAGRTLFTRFPAVVPDRQALRGYRGGELSRVETEQYMDFLAPIAFRSTLLCRREQELSPTLSLSAVSSLFVAGYFNAVFPEPDLKGLEEEEFCDLRGVQFTESNPLMKLALAALTSAWPRSLGLKEIYVMVMTELTGSPPGKAPTEEDLAAGILDYFRNGLVELCALPSNFSLDVPEKPCAHPYARIQAAGQQDWATNYRHEYVELSALERAALPLLDGTRDKAELVKLLETELAKAADLDADPARLFDDMLEMLAKGAFFPLSSAAPVSAIAAPTKAPTIAPGDPTSKKFSVLSLFRRTRRQR